MSKWRNKRENGIFYFLRFFAVFTSIFVALTFCILQTILSGTYTSVDKALMVAKKDTSFFIRQSLSIAVSQNKGYNSPLKVQLEGQIIANTDVMIYDVNKRLLNTIDGLSSLHYMEVDNWYLNDIVSVKVTNISGKPESYRMITVPVEDDFWPQARYLSVAINTTQLEESNKRHTKIILSLMFLFWVLSIGASLYLAKWSRKPILESYERQKLFVENASHELRTPLAVLQNRLELLFRKPKTTILDNSETIASSLEEVRNMRVLTSNLLDLARREDGISVKKEELAPSFFDKVGANYQLIAEVEDKQFELSNELKEPVYSDSALLKQLMTILFDNAIKYTDKDAHIIMTFKTHEKALIVRLADNGCGISDDDKQKIFDRFYRVDKARTRQKGGFGLGLSLAKQIVQALGGKLGVSDNQPKGSIFEVKIPQ